MGDAPATAPLVEQNLILQAGPFRVGVRSGEAPFLDTLSFFYRDSMWRDGPLFLDFDIRIRRPRSLRHLVRPQVIFEIDNLRPFEPQPVSAQ